MHGHNDKEEEAFREKLKNSTFQEYSLIDRALAGKDFREVILRQMQLTHALFQRQHQDV